MESQVVYTKTFSLENFPIETQSIIKDYICPLCKGVIYQPMSDSCGHIYCRKCFELFKATKNQYCPVDNTELSYDASIEIKVIKRILNRQELYCTNRVRHCQWRGPIISYDEHINNDCLKEIVPCTNDGCEQEITREELITHLKECEYRIETCQHCEVKLPFTDLNVHYEFCPKAIIDCPQLCDVAIVRESLQNHIQNDCLNTKVSCIYAEMKCKVNISRRNLNKHLEHNINHHMLLTYAYAKKIEKCAEEKANYWKNKIYQYEMQFSTIEKEKQYLKMKRNRYNDDDNNNN